MQFTHRLLLGTLLLMEFARNRASTGRVRVGDKYLVRHDDERHVGRAALVERYWIGDVEAGLSVPLADLRQVLPFQLEQIERHVGAAPLFEADGSRQADKVHLFDVHQVNQRKSRGERIKGEREKKHTRKGESNAGNKRRSVPC